ncbi:MAG TPA: hypothetical protein VJH96_03190 [Patescibacteria group bacterium]|nr:hypothetical protein [Patescibacteria group bacterium]
MSFPIVLVIQKDTDSEEYIERFISLNKIQPSYVFRYRKSGMGITIDQIREIAVFTRGIATMDRLFILYDFDTARKEAQNAFLKTLEEKSTHTFFIMIIREIGKLTPTLLSRAKIVRVKGEKTKHDAFSFADIFSFRDTVMTKEKALSLCDMILHACSQHIKEKKLQTKTAQVIINMIKETLRCRSLIRDNNVHAQMTMDHLAYSARQHSLVDKTMT